MQRRLFLIICIAITAMAITSCLRPRPAGVSAPAVSQVGSSVTISARATKLAQLVGDYDKERQQPTPNLTWTRYKLAGTDLGVPFRHKDRTYLLFGDTVGLRLGDAIAYTTDTSPEDGIDLVFVHDQIAYRPVKIPGISQAGFEVPTEGTSVNGLMYIYHTTDANKLLEFGKEREQGADMGRSIVAVSRDDGETFTYLYDLSADRFINVSIVQTSPDNIATSTAMEGNVLVIFGSGQYRRSNVYLAFQPAAQIGTRDSIRYFAGTDPSGKPRLSEKEEEAQPLFDQPCVGELSVSYNRFIDKWIMLYNCFFPKWRGINIRTADKPWGPWSEPQILFHPWDDNGYCHFMHVSWQYRNCDSVHDVNRENVWGGEYGPYQLEDIAIGDRNSTTIYFTMSTWNPYTVVLMKATLQKLH